MLKSSSSRGWLVIRDGLKDWLSDVAWPRVALTAIGAVVVIGGTLLPFAQQVYQSSPQNPLVVWNQSDWTFWFPFGFFSLHTLTNFPGLVIAIVAVVVAITFIEAAAMIWAETLVPPKTVQPGSSKLS